MAQAESKRCGKRTDRKLNSKGQQGACAVCSAPHFAGGAAGSTWALGGALGEGPYAAPAYQGLSMPMGHL